MKPGQLFLSLAYIALGVFAILGFYWAALILGVLVIVGNSLLLMASALK